METLEIKFRNHKARRYSEKVARKKEIKTTIGITLCIFVFFLTIGIIGGIENGTIPMPF